MQYHRLFAVDAVAKFKNRFCGLCSFVQLYSGFYKTRLEPHIQQPHVLLRLMGYERVPDDRLFLVNGVPPRAVLIHAAVTFFLAATECRIIASVVSRVEHSTPVEVYWMRRANVGDEEMCVDTLTLSRRPLSLDSERPSTFETAADVDRKFNTEVDKRGSSPYDNVEAAADHSRPQSGGTLVQPFTTQSPAIPPRSPAEGLPMEAQLPDPSVPAFSAFRQLRNVTGPVAAKSPLSNVGATVQHRAPEPPPPVYAEARHMPSAGLQNVHMPSAGLQNVHMPSAGLQNVHMPSAGLQNVHMPSAGLQNASYSPDDEVDALASLLRDVDPRLMEDATRRQLILSQLDNYPPSSSSSSSQLHRQQYADSVGTQWQCQQCTYSNDSSTHLCQMCNADRTQ